MCAPQNSEGKVDKKKMYEGEKKGFVKDCLNCLNFNCTPVSHATTLGPFLLSYTESQTALLNIHMQEKKKV